MLQSRTVLMCKRGRKYAQAVMLDGNVDVREFPVEAWWHPEKHGLRPLFFEQIGGVYPVDRAVMQLLKAGESLGITERARRLLESLLPVPRNLEVHNENKQESESK